MSIWKNRPTIEQLNLLNKNTLAEHLDIVLTEMGENWLSGSMPVDKRTCQPHKRLHGGASCVLAETLGSIAANLTLDYPKEVAVGQSISTNHIKPVTDGRVTGKASPVHLGKKTHIWQIEIR